MDSILNIAVNDRRKLFTIKEEFNKTFPYLKIEFFAKSQTVGGSPSKKLIAYSKTIGECRTLHNKGQLIITPNMTVAEMESYFSDVFGITIHVFRKSGKVWLDTSVTNGWTLAEQNRQGEMLSKKVA
jgi:hypothetical protein